MIRMLYLFSLTILYTINCNSQDYLNNKMEKFVTNYQKKTETEFKIKQNPTYNSVSDTKSDDSEIPGTVTVIINGEPIHNFVFDTGSDGFILMPEKKVKDLIKRGILFEKYILKEEKTFANAQGTKFKTKTIEAKEVQFGDTHLRWTEINYFKDAPYLLGNSIIKKGNFLFVGGEYYEIINKRKNKSDLDIKKTGTYYNSLNIINKTRTRKINTPTPNFLTSSAIKSVISEVIIGTPPKNIEASAL